MNSPFLSVQFIVVALMASVGLLTLGHWLKRSSFRVWSSAWLAWAGGAACLSLIPLMGTQWLGGLFLGHTLGYALFSLFLARGCLHTVKTHELGTLRVNRACWALTGLLAVLTALLAYWRWPGLKQINEVWSERHFWSSPWLIGFSFLSIWILAKHQKQWNVRPPSILLVLSLLILICTEGLHLGLLLGYENYPGRSVEMLVEFLLYLEPVFAGFVAVAMHAHVMDGLVHHLERTMVEMSKNSAKLKVMAERDPLTAVLNRHAFYSMVSAKREGKEKPLGGSVAVLDIDNLKPLNDQYGHPAGDAAIRAVAKAIRTVVRAEDLLFRWGGDEFLVILPHVNVEEARWRFQKIDELLQKLTLPGVPEPTTITLSIGVSPFSSTMSLEKAIEEADERMYSRKGERRRSSIQP